jgi:hypothetical protein
LRHAADEEALEVQLGRDAHEQVDVQRVHVRDEGACRRPAREGLEHGRLDLDEPARIHEAADGRDDLRAQLEDRMSASGFDQMSM